MGEVVSIHETESVSDGIAAGTPAKNLADYEGLAFTLDQYRSDTETAYQRLNMLVDPTLAGETFAGLQTRRGELQALAKDLDGRIQRKDPSSSVARDLDNLGANVQAYIEAVEALIQKAPKSNVDLKASTSTRHGYMPWIILGGVIAITGGGLYALHRRQKLLAAAAAPKRKGTGLAATAMPFAGRKPKARARARRK